MKIFLALAMLAGISSASLAGSMFDNQQTCTTTCSGWGNTYTCTRQCW